MKIIKVGRAQSNDVIIESPTVSGIHAEIIVTTPGDILIRDKNSTNGTYVNGKKIADDTPLTPGDKVMLGKDYLNWEKAINEPPKTKIGNNQNIGNENSITIGRSQDAQYQMPESDVSAIHATLTRNSDGTISITDNHSTNGTFVNGTKINHRILKSGDQVSIAGRHNLNWESLFATVGSSGNSTPIIPQKPKRGFVWVLVAIGIALIVGIAGWLGWEYYQNNSQLEAREIYDNYQKSVVMIYSVDGYEASVDGTRLDKIDDVFKNISVTYLDENKELQTGYRGVTGTGFFISEDGKIMTNKHVVSAMEDENGDAEIIKLKLQQEIYSSLPLTKEVANILQNLKVTYKNFYTGIALNDTHVRAQEDFTSCTILKTSDDDKLDLAILQINNKKTPNEVKNIVDLENIASPKNLSIGNKIYTIGFPFADIIGGTDIGLEANNQSGEITQLRGAYEYGHNIAIQQGASGSPVFDKQGKFAGVIVSGFLDAGSGYNQAINPQKAAQFGNSVK